MIITDIKQLRKIPVGTEAEFSLKFKVVETSMKAAIPCRGCVFYWTECPDCQACVRPDGKEVKFVKF